MSMVTATTTGKGMITGTIKAADRRGPARKPMEPADMATNMVTARVMAIE